MRIYQPVPMAVNHSIILDPNASHHLSRVLRVTRNDPIILFNGQGGEYEGRITHIDKKQVTVQLEKFTDKKIESPLTLYLAQGISRGDKMDYTMQKAVELGVKKIFPLFTEYCNVKLDKERSEKRLRHWQEIVIHACQQSGRTEVPEIAFPQTFAEWMETVTADHRLVLSPTGTHHLTDFTLPAKEASVVVLIGSEGGLSEQEEAIAVRNQFLPVNIGPRILRTETAAVAVLAIMQARFGDM